MAGRAGLMHLRSVNRPPMDEAEAWLAGMIATDGNASEKHGLLRLSQCERNAREVYPLLERRFGRAFSVDRKRQFSISFAHLPLRWKTEPPRGLGELRCHYVRGLIDGDGCWSSSGTSKLRCQMLVRTDEWWIMDCVVDYLLSLGIDPGAARPHSKTPKVWYIELSAAKAARLASVLYPGAEYYIRRKKEIACSIL